MKTIPLISLKDLSQDSFTSLRLKADPLQHTLQILSDKVSQTSPKPTFDLDEAKDFSVIVQKIQKQFVKFSNLNRNITWDAIKKQLQSQLDQGFKVHLAWLQTQLKEKDVLDSRSLSSDYSQIASSIRTQESAFKDWKLFHQ